MALGVGVAVGWAGRPADCQVDEGFTRTEPNAAALSALPEVLGVTTFPPLVPPPSGRTTPARVVVEMTSTSATLPITPLLKYPAWTFDGRVPGSVSRCRVGDTLELRFTNKDVSGIGHNVDLHAVTGPGGGAPATYAEQDQTKVGYFKLLFPGVFVYHCAAAPVPVHIANGMYGVIIVDPEVPLPPVDREYCVVQSEFYYEEAAAAGGGGAGGDDELVAPSYANGLREAPQLVVFNGREGALTEKPLMAKQGERVRLYFVNAGPNLFSAFHVIGSVFDRVYRDGDVTSPPARGVSTVAVPPGGATIVELDCTVPGSYTLVDHAIFRIDKGAVGFLKVTGNDPRRDVYASADMPITCPGCKLHN